MHLVMVNRCCGLGLFSVWILSLLDLVASYDGALGCMVKGGAKTIKNDQKRDAKPINEEGNKGICFLWEKYSMV